MAASRFDFEVLNDREVGDEITDLGDRATNAEPLLRGASQLIARGIQRNFQSQGRALGTPWPAKADGTPATLDAGGGLAAAVANLTRTTKTMAVAGIKGPEAHIARFHQGGTSRGLPARPIVGIAAHDRSLLLRMVNTYLTGHG